MKTITVNLTETQYKYIVELVESDLIQINVKKENRNTLLSQLKFAEERADFEIRLKI